MVFYVNGFIGFSYFDFCKCKKILGVSYHMSIFKCFLGLISSQIINIPQPVLGIPGRRSKALYELVFPVDTLPGLAISNFQITRNTTEDAHLLKLRSQLKAIKKGGESYRPSKHSDNSREDFMIKNSNVSLPTASLFLCNLCINR